MRSSVNGTSHGQAVSCTEQIPAGRSGHAGALWWAGYPSRVDLSLTTGQRSAAGNILIDIRVHRVLRSLHPPTHRVLPSSVLTTVEAGAHGLREDAGRGKGTIPTWKCPKGPGLWVCVIHQRCSAWAARAARDFHGDSRQGPARNCESLDGLFQTRLQMRCREWGQVPEQRLGAKRELIGTIVLTLNSETKQPSDKWARAGALAQGGGTCLARS